MKNNFPGKPGLNSPNRAKPQLSICIAMPHNNQPWNCTGTQTWTFSFCSWASGSAGQFCWSEISLAGYIHMSVISYELPRQLDWSLGSLMCPGPWLGQSNWHHFAPCSSSRRTESSMFSWQRQRSKNREYHKASWGLVLEPPPCHFCHFLLPNKVTRSAKIQRVGKQILPLNERNYKDILQGVWI